jgi:hypothetical protein
MYRRYKVLGISGDTRLNEFGEDNEDDGTQSASASTRFMKSTSNDGNVEFWIPPGL